MTESTRFALHWIDWAIIAAYLAFALVIGLRVKGDAETDSESYFLAGRSAPWWWAGLSIAATTFAADTPLAVTGIVADRGLSGNWMWLSWIGVHAAVVVYFASRWRKSGVVTDAELVSLRYAGRSAQWLRWFRAFLYGVVYNAIILGWVLTAMVKIVTPFFHWDAWFPRGLAAIAAVWPEGGALGTPSEGLTIIALLAIVGLYSSLGGIRGVMSTDVVQLGLALFGSVWLAAEAWSAVGGRSGLTASLTELYGDDHSYLDLFWNTDAGWMHALELGAFAFGVYLLVQSYANVPSDGGGYLMQRLGSTKTPRDATRASLLFVLLQYTVRTWPWMIVALAALALIPIGQDAALLGGDRELAYPVLMAQLLPPAILGMMVASLLAAFMSTVDTHLNWGASYLVNDVFLAVRPQATGRQQVQVARLAVAAFVVAAVIVSFQIQTIEQAWRWVAALGAALGIPTALRWFWHRMTAPAEICAAVFGLATAWVLIAFTELPYERTLIAISAASVVGLVLGVALARPTPPAVVERFVQQVSPHGFWPGVDATAGARTVARDAVRWAALTGGVVLVLFGTHRILLLGETAIGLAGLAAGIAAIVAAGRTP